MFFSSRNQHFDIIILFIDLNCFLRWAMWPMGLLFSHMYMHWVVHMVQMHIPYIWFLSISLFSVGETQSTTLPHFYPFNLDGKKVTWYYMDNGKNEYEEVNTCKDPWQLTIDNNLVLSRASKEDNDRNYKAFLGDKLLHTITVKLMDNGKYLHLIVTHLHLSRHTWHMEGGALLDQLHSTLNWKKIINPAFNFFLLLLILFQYMFLYNTWDKHK